MDKATTAVEGLVRAVQKQRQPHPEDASESMRRILPPEDLLERLRQRYTSDPVPPCQVCGGELEVQSMGGGMATTYGCPRPEGVPFGEWNDHYQESRWTQMRSGDSDVIALVDAVRGAITAEDEPSSTR